MRKRRGFWYYIRRVPSAVLHLERSSLVMRSTGIRIAHDPRGIIARSRVTEIDAEQTLRWSDLAAGRDPGDRQNFERCLLITNRFGIPYLQRDEIDRLDEDSFLARMSICRNNTGKDVVCAVMGMVPKPSLMLSDLVEEYFNLNEASLKTKSPLQLRKWRVARESCMDTFIKIIGSDIPVADLQRTHVLKVRHHWNSLATQGSIQIESANKYLGRLAAMIKAVAEAHQLHNGAVFDRIFIKGGKTGKRVSFETEWVQNTLLADGALDGLNAEARAIVYLVVETGVRLVEACNLDKSSIVLDHEIPHIRIRANGRQLKTDQSERDIPLVGVALIAMQKHPDGFPRYMDKNPQASAAINKFLRSKFSVKDGQTLYSLRHTFKDRLRSIRCQDEISARLMGHEYGLPDYGEPSLEDKLFWLKKIAFRPPSRV